MEHQLDIAAAVEEPEAGPSPTAKALHERVMQDEWGRIYEFHCQLGKQAEEEAKQAVREKQTRLRGILEEQVKELQQRKQAEAAAKKVELEGLQAARQKWQQEEAARAAARRSAIEQLKADRRRQLEEANERRQQALEASRRQQQEMQAKLMHDMKQELESEHNIVEQSKRDLRAFLSANASNEEDKRAAKERQREEEVKYMHQYSAMLDRQEAQRHALVNKMRARQTKQAQDAATRPEAKRWIDPAIIDKHYTERERAAQEEEARRKAAVAARCKQAKEAQLSQIEEKKREAALEAEERHREHEQLLKELEAARLAEQEAKRKEKEKQAAIKQMLDCQVRDNAERKRVQLMTETERKLNAKLLQEAQQRSPMHSPTTALAH